MFIMSLLFYHELACQLYVKSSTHTREKFVDVQKVAAAVGHNMCCALPGLHSFTGFDTLSTFGGKSKISAFKLMQENRKYQDAFTQLGKEWSVSRDLFSMLQEFTCEVSIILRKERRGQVRTASFL